MDRNALVHDLFRRVEEAVYAIAQIVSDTGVTLSVDNVVEKVERGLPSDYPAPKDGATARRNIIRRMANDIISGEAYEN